MSKDQRTFKNKIFIAETIGILVFAVPALIYLIPHQISDAGDILAWLILIVNLLIYSTSIKGIDKNISANNEITDTTKTKDLIFKDKSGNSQAVPITVISNEYDNELNSSNLWEGTIRGALIFFTIIVAGFFIWRDISNPENIPGHLIVVLGLIMAYYKIEPKEVLPPPLVPIQSGNLSTPKTNLDLINSFPKIKKAIKTVEEKKETIFEELERVLGEKSNWVGKTIDDIENVKDSINNNLIDIENLTKKLTIDVKSRVESIGLICLLFFIAIVNMLYLGSGTTDGSFEPIKIIASSIFAGIGIATGKAIDDLLYRNVRKPINNAFRELNEGLNEVKSFLGDTGNEINNFKILLDDRINTFKKQNFLSYFSPHVSAVIAVNAMAFLSILLLLNPLSSVNHPLFIGMEFIISYYFVSKK